MNIYLAGKISRNGWRHSIVEGLRGTNYDWDIKEYGLGTWLNWPRIWPALPRAIFETHDYVGPFFVSDDHGCGHGVNSHGCGADHPHRSYCISETDESGRQQKIVSLCLAAIETCDLFFAWIDSQDAYGTIAEIGYAAGLQKHVYIAWPKPIDDLWFVYRISTLPFGISVHKTPEDGLRAAIDEYCELNKEEIHKGNLESPIEEMFWSKGCAYIIDGLVPQVKVGRYRLDFGIPEDKIGIELDGHAYHSTKPQREKDAQRQRFLEKQGWRIIRFTGTEVYRDPGKCVDDAAELIEQYRGTT